MLLKFINTDMYILSPCEFMLIIAYEYDTLQVITLSFGTLLQCHWKGYSNTL